MTDQLPYGLAHGGEGDIAFASCYCYYFRVGRAVSRSIDLSTMLYLIDYCNFMSFFLEVTLCFAVVGVVDFDFDELALLWICVAGCDDGEEAGVVLVCL